MFFSRKFCFFSNPKQCPVRCHARAHAVAAFPITFQRTHSLQRVNAWLQAAMPAIGTMRNCEKNRCGSSEHSATLFSSPFYIRAFRTTEATVRSFFSFFFCYSGACPSGVSSAMLAGGPLRKNEERKKRKHDECS